MTRNSRPHDSDHLDPPVKAAVEAVLAEPLPEDAVQRVLERALRLATVTLPPARSVDEPRRRGRASRSRVGAFAAAAAIMAAAVGVAMLLDRSDSRAFAQAIERIRAAGAVQFSIITRFGHQPEQTGRMSLEGQRMRFEQNDGRMVTVGDLERGRGVLFDMRDMQFRELALADEARLANPIDQLRQAKSEDATLLGQERLDGRLTDVYRLDRVDLLGIKGDAETMVWIDVASNLPAQIVIRDTDPKHLSEFRFEDFAWNEPLEADLFSLEIPAEFTPMPQEKFPMPEKSVVFNDQREADADSPVLADGVIRDRVPAQIMWGPQGRTITALVRDPESTAPQARRQNQLRQWNASTGQMHWSHDVLGANHVASSPDAAVLATVIGYEVQLRDAATGEVTRAWATEETLLPLAFSPDGKTLAAGIAEWGPHGGRGGKMSGGVQFWNVEEGTLARTIDDDKPTTFLCYSPDGKLLATSSNEGPVKLWNLATGRLERLLLGRLAAFSPDGRTIACIANQPDADRFIGRIDLYNAADGTRLKTFSSERGAKASWLLCVVFSPDGERLAATDWNGIVSVWDVAAGDRLPVGASHAAGVLTAAFSPDGATLATGSEDQTLRLWNLSKAGND